MKKKVPEILNRIADVVLAYTPKPKTKAQKKRARKAVQGQPYCPSCRKRGVPVLCWICKMQMCLRCAKPHGAKSVCGRCLQTL